ncbi:MAG: aminopeptidase [Ignavibacteria bacterium]|jgi:leucyl aminopeptidase (aminopeptidase T)|nr:aminopeptidase [Ignavibacteria bacterium]
MTKLENSAHRALVDYMGLTAHETLLVICDEPTREIGIALQDAGRKICLESYYLEMRERDINGQEPPAVVAEFMSKVDVVICATYRSLTHTNARRLATKAGVRVGTMPGITVPTLNRCFLADSDEIIETNNKLVDILDNAKEIVLTTSLGTNAKFSAVGRKIISSTGVHRNMGEWGNIPSGEVYFAPVEDAVNGRLVIDGSVAGIGMLNENIIIEIKNGMISSILGGEQGTQLDDMLTKVGGKAKAVAEFGIGTNPKADICGLILEDEKVMGTVHIAFGNNISMDGSINVPIHIDCIIKSPTFTVDGKVIMDNGKLLID